MNEIFKTLLEVCGAVVAILLTLCVIKAAFYYLFGSAPKEAFPRAPGDDFPQMPPEVSTQTLLETMAALPPPPKAELEPEMAGIECGHCHQEIKTSPVSLTNEGMSDEKVIFRCEHCGTEVAMPSND